MTAYEVELLAAEICDGEVGRFRFSRPDGYAFVAGQHLTMSLAMPGGTERRVFTIASAPQDDGLEICTRLTGSSFKRALSDLPVGGAAVISAASGHLRLAEKGRITGFLVGGVGVTPAHSMIRDVMLRATGQRIVLFQGDRSARCMPYAHEFEEWSSRNERFTYMPVVEHPDAGWRGEQGFIGPDMVARIVADPQDVDWIVSGPPVMVDAMKGVAARLDIPPARLQVESFAGYGTAPAVT